MNDRDTFAAAALTGLLAGRKFTQLDDAIVAEPYARASYGLADAMLARRSHSAKPSGVAEAYATAKQISDAQDFVRDREEFKAWNACRAGGKTSVDMDRTDKAAPRPDAGTGNTIDVEELIAELREPGASKVSGDIRDTCRDAAAAIERLRTWVNELQMSAEERVAVEWAISAAENEMHPADTLRKLLERLK